MNARHSGSDKGIFGFLSDNAGWLTVGAMLTFLSSFGQTFFISIFAGEIRAEFGLSHGQWGGAYSIGTTAAAVVMVWAGGLTDQFRVRGLAPIVLIGLAAACLAMAFNPWAAALPLVIFLLRLFGQSMASHLAAVAMVRWFVASRGRALSVATLGFSFGEAMLPILFVSLMAFMDWHLLWVVAALICLATLPVFNRLLRTERTPQSHAHEEHGVGMQSRHWTRGQALRDPLFWFMVPALLGPPAFNTAFFFHQVHFADVKGMEHLTLVAFFPFYTACTIAMMVVSGWALDRWGTGRLMPWYQLPMVLAFLAFAVSTGPGMLGVGLLLLALSTGCNSTLPNAFWAEFYGTAHIGSIKAMAAAVMVLGSAIGPGLTGALIDAGMGIERQYVFVAAYFLVTTATMAIGITRARKRF